MLLLMLNELERIFPNESPLKNLFLIQLPDQAYKMVIICMKGRDMTHSHMYTLPVSVYIKTETNFGIGNTTILYPKRK